MVKSADDASFINALIMIVSFEFLNAPVFQQEAQIILKGLSQQLQQAGWKTLVLIENDLASQHDERLQLIYHNLLNHNEITLSPISQWLIQLAAFEARWKQAQSWNHDHSDGIVLYSHWVDQLFVKNQAELDQLTINALWQLVQGASQNTKPDLTIFLDLVGIKNEAQSAEHQRYLQQLANVTQNRKAWMFRPVQIIQGKSADGNMKSLQAMINEIFQIISQKHQAQLDQELEVFVAHFHSSDD